MVFRGGDGKQVGYARSEDGLTWEHDLDGPILGPRDAGVTELYFVSFLHHNGTDYVYFEGGSYTGAQGFLATRNGSSS